MGRKDALSQRAGRSGLAIIGFILYFIFYISLLPSSALLSFLLLYLRFASEGGDLYSFTVDTYINTYGGSGWGFCRFYLYFGTSLDWNIFILRLASWDITWSLFSKKNNGKSGH